MCLHPKTDESIHVTDHDIVVYKILRLDNSSMFQNFQYEPNRLYHGPALSYFLPFVDAPFIEKGFHAYVDELAAERNCVPYSKVVTFTIPKGATVCYGWFDEIVSDTIISGSLEGRPAQVFSLLLETAGTSEIVRVDGYDAELAAKARNAGWRSLLSDRSS